MNNVVKAIGSLIVTFAILGLPVLVCLSFVLGWHAFFQLMLIVAAAVEVIFIWAEVWGRSEE